MAITELNSESKVHEKTKIGVVVLDFFSNDCPPCKKLMPILEQVEKELAGQVNFFKVNIDRSEKVANAYGIEVVPTILIFKDGKMVNTILGLLPKDKVLNKIKAAIG